MDCLTFGGVVRNARKQANMQQLQLAERIYSKDGHPITPQYLSDIEHGRRTPTDDYLIEQFAAVLGLSADYLHYLNGKFPEQERREKRTLQHFELSMNAFRVYAERP